MPGLHQPDNRRKESSTTVRERFDTPEAAAKYARSLGGSATHRREVGCIQRGLRDVPAGSHVLDLPCGTDRLTPVLLELGYRVTAADSSPHMVEQAKLFLDREGIDRSRVTLAVADAFSTGFADDAFDAVVCNRLLHHFPEPPVRQRALRELARICTGPIVASFFCNQSWDGVVFHVRDMLRRKKANDRVPISLAALKRDAEAVGLNLVEHLAARPAVSKQHYVVLRRSSRPVG